MPLPRSTIRLVTVADDEWVASQEGKYLDHRHYDTRIGGESVWPRTVLKPDGSPLLLYLPRAIDPAVCRHARPALRKAARWSEHRRLRSGIVGYYRDDARSECRATAFTSDDLSQWGRILPFVRAANVVFRQRLPSRYLPQRKLALRTSPDWIIADTAFTTVTVNRWDARHDARTRVHRDDGDLPEGFGVISILNSGRYTGGELIFLKYRVAVDMREGDVLLCDVHEFHGNAPMKETEPGWERIACILYYRENMRGCRPAGVTTPA